MANRGTSSNHQDPASGTDLRGDRPASTRWQRSRDLPPTWLVCGWPCLHSLWHYPFQSPPWSSLPLDSFSFQEKIEGATNWEGHFYLVTIPPLNSNISPLKVCFQCRVQGARRSGLRSSKPKRHGQVCLCAPARPPALCPDIFCTNLGLPPALSFPLSLCHSAVGEQRWPLLAPH